MNSEVEKMENQKILIVDDRPENLTALTRVLCSIGVELVSATSGQQALELTLDNEFSMAILDAQMPGMDGFDLALLLRGQEETSHLPIIFLSAAYSDFSHVFKGYESGAVDYLVKPYDPDILCGKVKIFLELDRHRNRLTAMVKEKTEMLSEANKRLNCQKVFLENIIESLTFPLVVIDPIKHEVELSNSSARAYAENAGAEHGDKTCYSYLHRGADFCTQGAGCGFIKVTETGAPYSTEFERLEKDGLIHYYEVKGFPIVDDSSNAMPKIIESVFDVTQRRMAEENQRVAAEVIDNVMEDIIVVNTLGIIEFANPAFLLTTGYTHDEVIGQHISFFRSDRHDDDFYLDVFKSLADAGQWKGELWSNRKSGAVYPQWVSATGVTDQSGTVTHYVAAGRDVTQVKAAEEEIRFRAYHDPLTGLPNRLLFKDRLQHAIARAERNNERIAVLFIDLDHFKNFNDSMGHSVGDELLKIVAAEFVGCVRAEDTVARIGGDEFTIIMENISSLDDVEHVAKKLISIFDLPINIAGDAAYLGASIGIAIYPDNGIDVEALTKLADTAMYCVKDEGRNGFRFITAAMERRIVDRMTMEMSMREGLERDEFKVHYQPIVDIQRGKIIGMEALLRWQKPDEGLMLAGSFVPLAESRGLIVPLGEWVLQQACRDLEYLELNSDEPLLLTINLSARQFREKHLVDSVNNVLLNTQIAPENLILEITETTIMENVESAVAIMNEIKRMGVKLAMDDFGTGYSSFNYLKSFPVDYLKLDHSFMEDICNGGDASKIAMAVISLAKELGLIVIAEGVEVKAQLDFLKSSGCDFVQGFYFSKSLAKDDFMALVEHGV